jgi:hypothetical protein
MFCPKASGKIKSALKQFDQYVDAHIELALQVTTALKKILSSPVTDIITAIIPGNLDDNIRTQLINALNKAIEALTIVDSCRQCTGLDDKLKCFVQQIQQRDPQLQDAILQKLASLLASGLDGQRLKQALYDLYTQAKYVTTK